LIKIQRTQKNVKNPSAKVERLDGTETKVKVAFCLLIRTRGDALKVVLGLCFGGKRAINVKPILTRNKEPQKRHPLKIINGNKNI